jgi:hypothetical protein
MRQYQENVEPARHACMQNGMSCEGSCRPAVPPAPYGHAARLTYCRPGTLAAPPKYYMLEVMPATHVSGTAKNVIILGNLNVCCAPAGEKHVKCRFNTPYAGNCRPYQSIPAAHMLRSAVSSAAHLPHLSYDRRARAPHSCRTVLPDG